MSHQHLLDTQGLYCPEPVMMLHSMIDEMQSGDIVKIIASDPATQRDIPKFCQFLGHELLEASEQDGLFIYFLKKASV
jgi:tRNA 2-thiouridine synthesizing protein A